MMSGVLPFTGENDPLLMERIVKEPPQVPETVDTDTASLIRRLLEKDPAKRIGFEEIAEHPFFDGIDWEIVAERGYETEWKPALGDGGMSTYRLSHEDLTDSTAAPTTGTMNVEGFSYVSPFPAGATAPYIDGELVGEYEGLAKDLDDI
jgi:serine/threonine protein kinase